MTTQTAPAPNKEITQRIAKLSTGSLDKLAEFIAFLEYQERIEELEDAEDLAYIESLTPEDYADAVPLEEVIADYEKKYGPLD